MTKRISKEVKAIADAHIQAKFNNNFDNPEVHSKEDVMKALREGKTFKEVLDQIEWRYCSVTSMILSSHFFHNSKTYTACVYKGFKALLQN